MDNLNTHHIGSRYKRYLPAEAKRLLDKLKVHHTPKHGGWLNIAEIGLNVMTRQRLNRRIPAVATLRHELTTWCTERNRKGVAVKRQFTKADAELSYGRCLRS